MESVLDACDARSCIHVAVGPAAMAGPPGDRCVRVGAACYPTVQAAVDAAQDGDTVRIPAGRFAGGVVITKSITIAGAGAASTHLVGGEHVLTVGTWMAPSPPEVHISGVTLRGGRAHNSPGVGRLHRQTGRFRRRRRTGDRSRRRPGHGGGLCDHRQQRQPG